MKQFFAAALLGLGLIGAAHAADPAVGTWQTQVDDGAYAHVKMAPLRRGDLRHYRAHVQRQR